MNSPYVTLGISPKASGADIKRAYRNLAKAFHPDVNRRRDSGTRMQEVNDAYAIVGDPVKRAEYDQMQQMQSSQTHHKGTEQPGHIGCMRCGKVDSTLRVSTFTTVWSFIYFSFYKGWAYILCTRCRTIISLRYNVQVLIFGWWGIPWGPLWSISSLYKNSTGGHQPRENNATLLAIVGQNLISIGDYVEAERALITSLRLKEDPVVQKLLQIAKSKAEYRKSTPLTKQFIRLQAHPACYNALLIITFVTGTLVLISQNPQTNERGRTVVIQSATTERIVRPLYSFVPPTTEWRPVAKSKPDYDIQYNISGGRAVFYVISEEGEVENESGYLKNLTIEGWCKVCPGTAVRRSESVTIANKIWTHIQCAGMSNGVKMIFDAYLYSGKEGTFQMQAVYRNDEATEYTHQIADAADSFEFGIDPPTLSLEVAPRIYRNLYSVIPPSTDWLAVSQTPDQPFDIRYNADSGYFVIISEPGTSPAAPFVETIKGRLKEAYALSALDEQPPLMVAGENWIHLKGSGLIGQEYFDIDAFLYSGSQGTFQIYGIYPSNRSEKYLGGIESAFRSFQFAQNTTEPQGNTTQNASTTVLDPILTIPDPDVITKTYTVSVVTADLIVNEFPTATRTVESDGRITLTIAATPAVQNRIIRMIYR